MTCHKFSWWISKGGENFIKVLFTVFRSITYNLKHDLLSIQAPWGSCSKCNSTFKISVINRYGHLKFFPLLLLAILKCLLCDVYKIIFKILYNTLISQCYCLPLIPCPSNVPSTHSPLKSYRQL